ncbi:hypothetical protein KIPB_002720 [Kipferlia bialata]|uniref:Uncharacterized protein n=1 Tax=Kipferlia bialata TaxID=797122 RepID=A0A9K3GGV8_9EUKA|nr:hypothetical protein KIPB_002720 [Kipferlia bialata]|eukprot:g2720.t1
MSLLLKTASGTIDSTDTYTVTFTWVDESFVTDVETPYPATYNSATQQWDCTLYTPRSVASTTVKIHINGDLFMTDDDVTPSLSSSVINSTSPVMATSATYKYANEDTIVGARVKDEYFNYMTHSVVIQAWAHVGTANEQKVTAIQSTEDPTLYEASVPVTSTDAFFVYFHVGPDADSLYDSGDWEYIGNIQPARDTANTVQISFPTNPTAGRSFSFTLGLYDATEMLLTFNSNLEVTFTSATYTETITPSFNSSTDLYTVIGSNTLKYKSGVYTLSVGYSNQSTPFVANAGSIIIETAAADAADTTVTPPENPVAQEYNDFVMTLLDIYGNVIGEPTDSATYATKAEGDVTLTVTGSGWSNVGTFIWDAARSALVASVFLDDAGPATYAVAIEGDTSFAISDSVEVEVNPNPPGEGGNGILIAVIVIVVLGLGVGGYFGYRHITKPKQSKEDAPGAVVDCSSPIDTVPDAVEEGVDGLDMEAAADNSEGEGEGTPEPVQMLPGQIASPVVLVPQTVLVPMPMAPMMVPSTTAPMMVPVVQEAELQNQEQ